MIQQKVREGDVGIPVEDHKVRAKGQDKRRNQNKTENPFHPHRLIGGKKPAPRDAAKGNQQRQHEPWKQPLLPAGEAGLGKSKHGKIKVGHERWNTHVAEKKVRGIGDAFPQGSIKPPLLFHLIVGEVLGKENQHA